MQLTFTKLWDALLGRAVSKQPASRAAAAGRSSAVPAAKNVVRRRVPAAVPGMAEKYDAMTRELLAHHGVRVRKWRTSMSGVAWCVRYRDGREVRLIEAPRPVGPMSAAVFCHEIGHHAIGFNVYSPRCLEEYHAWAWALAEMERRGLNVTDKVRARMRKSLEYAVAKSLRRGIRSIPPELAPYVPGASKYLR